MHERLKQFDFRRYPLRGLLSEIAREDGISRQAIRNSILKGKPAMIARIIRKAKSRLDKAARLPKRR